MTLNEFIDLDKPEKYNFTDECTCDTSYKDKTGLDKFFEYRINSKVKDPDDSSILLQDIYKIVWKDLVEKGKHFMYANDDRIASDTMTSAWVPIKNYMRKNFKSELDALKVEKNIEELRINYVRNCMKQMKR